MAKLSKKQRRLAQDMMLAGGAVAAADKIYQTGKKIVKGIKEKRAKKKAEKEAKKNATVTVGEVTVNPEELSITSEIEKGTAKKESIQSRKYHNNTYEEAK